MPRLFECNKWRILQALGGLLAGRQAKFQSSEPSDESQTEPNYEFLEVELRRTFLPRDSSKDLAANEFELLQATLRALCTLLEKSVVVEGQALVASEDADLYPRLRRLVAILAASTDIVDLVVTPNKAGGIFDMSAQIKKSLDSISECNDTIVRLLSSAAAPIPQAPPKSKDRKPWKNCQKRRRAVSVLRALFGRFRSASRTVSIITSICDELDRQPGQGMCLTLLIEAYGVFGAWTPLVSAHTEAIFPEATLNGLIAKGAFEPALRFDTFKTQDPSFIRFSPLEMRKLAVELGYLLMDFFDAHLSAERIYFLRQSSMQQQKPQPCVAFNSNLPTTQELHTFQMVSQASST